jgi:ParB family transcriptional regulator, chromosome partitioning protein
MPPKKRPGLGRGLGALLTNPETYAPASAEVIAQAEAGGVRLVSASQISPNPRQPRTDMDETALAELAASIRQHGIIQPLIVTASPDQPDHYWLIAGERRWRAAQAAEVEEIPVIVREVSPQQLLEWALVENVQRADLSPLEEAAAYRDLMQEFHLTQAQVADRVGKSRSAVANTVRLLQLPAKAQAALNHNQISAGHARALLALPDHQTMEEVLERTLQHGLTVRQLEVLVQRMLTPSTKPPSDTTKQEPDFPAMRTHLRLLEDRFRNTLGTRVALERKGDGSGRLIIHYYSDDDLEQIYRQIVGEDEIDQH